MIRIKELLVLCAFLFNILPGNSQELSGEKLFEKIRNENIIVKDSLENVLSYAEIQELIFFRDTVMNCFDANSEEEISIVSFPYKLECFIEEDSSATDVFKILISPETGKLIGKKYLFTLKNHP